MNQNGDQEQRGVVVVGVDGSAGANAALRWAATEARLRETRLRVVHAWSFSYVMGVELGGGYLVGATGATPDVDIGNRRRAAAQLLDHAIGQLPVEEREAERVLIEGTAAEALVSAATERDLLVVGSRGRGGFVGLLLGSVSQQCAHHAPCPVVIVHAPQPADGSDPTPAPDTERSAA